MDPPWLGQRHAVFVPVRDSHVDPDPVPDFVQRTLAANLLRPRSGHRRRPVTTALHFPRLLRQGFTGRHRHRGRHCELTRHDGCGATSIPAQNPTTWWSRFAQRRSRPRRVGLVDNPPISGIGDFCRVNLDEGLGTWAMEVMHCLTGFLDLYNFQPHPGASTIWRVTAAPTRQCIRWCICSG